MSKGSLASSLLLIVVMVLRQLAGQWDVHHTLVSPSSALFVSLDGKTITFPDQDPLEQSGLVMVPVNAILEALGAKVCEL